MGPGGPGEQLIREAIEKRVPSCGGGGLRRAFQMFDRDRSGSISYAEFRSGLKEYAMLDFSGEVMGEVLRAFDGQNLGRLRQSHNSIA